MKALLSTAEILVNKLMKEKKVEILEDSSFEKVLNEVEKDVEDYRFDNQQKIKDSLEEISTVIFTA